MEDGVIPNDEDINDEILIDDDDSLASVIDHLQYKILEIEWVDKEYEGSEIEELGAEN